MGGSNVILFCAMIGQIKSRDLGSKIKKLIKFMKPHNIQTDSYRLKLQSFGIGVL